MRSLLPFLIVDGYPKPNRDHFKEVGMTPAGKLFASLLLQHLPEAQYNLIYPSDPGVQVPDSDELKKYGGILWPGCNLTIYHKDDERVVKMIDLAKTAYEVGIPQFGNCWGAQIAVCAAGGEVKKNPKGREIGIARKIHLTADGKQHPMYEGKPFVFDSFSSHYDEITKLPEGTTCLASNDFTDIQAVSVEYKNGVFWATQYHLDYNLHEVARLMVAGEEKLISEGFFKNHHTLVEYVEQLETIAADPSHKDLRWRYGIDDDLLSDNIRQCEFVNWLNKIALPKVTCS